MDIKQADRKRIDRIAPAAAKAGTSIKDSCPYPLNSAEGQHFTAVYLLHAPRFVAQPRRVIPSKDNTTCPELTDARHRAGSAAHRAHPSRVGNRLHYPDGRITDLAGTPIPTFVGVAS